ncbi:septation protein SepH [Actinomyces sp. B33]|uniref:septation protein SepH n=1 Tax=Actinomyces sp. B33 TaxID=2942131 RepID=UPI002340D0E7|nr:septation protein SepH [Actinomyces sp. B33]MDC4233186.1 septation protein SepH [Actinomyces sp. B33]
MIELELLGIGGDGETLVLTDRQGERYSVQITDELRGSVRRDRPRIDAAPDLARPVLRPGEIQALLRAGATPEDIASRHGMELRHVQRFEAPVAAEKDYALSRALATRIGQESDGPTMRDLVIDRLAARGVSPDSLEWSAQREASGPWQICLTFVQGAAEHGAHWLFTASGALEAVDQEARWITETVSQTPAASIFTPLPAPERDEADLEEVRSREAILDRLNAARGKRQEIEYDLDDDPRDEAAPVDEEPASPEAEPSSISARIYSLAHARTKEEPLVVDDHDERAPASRDTTAFWLTASAPSRPEHPTETAGADDQPDPVEGPAAAPVPPAATAPSIRVIDEPRTGALPGMEDLDEQEPSRKAKSKRRSVPSWDEIVFGSKPK